MTDLLEKMAKEMENATPEAQAQAIEILGMIDGFAEQRNDIIKTVYDGIDKLATEGERDAQLVMNYGSETEVKSAINDSINRKSY